MLMSDAKILSIQVGLPQEHGTEGAENPLERPWVSSIFKYPVEGSVHVGKINIAGDKQADLTVHGGKEKAVMVYDVAHYDYWREALPHLEWVHGGFGENLTVDGLTENTVAIGDIYAVGDVRFEVTQPRFPCWKLARRWLQKDLTARVQQTGYTGWYYRVLEEGDIEAGMPITLLEKPHPEWTIIRATHVMRHYKEDLDATRDMMALPALAPSWRTWLEENIQ